ncbi:MAG: helix-turn-helix domain-containing protein [Leptospiraceae bacterium]|nr:helix-turn-helix domain-containing protein [Leptospiraceae bacterium]
MVLAKRVGAILKESRESRKLSVRDVARETNMTPKYIEALEAEDYSQFPGETYTTGFLRSYAEYLNLDSDHILNLYRGIQIDQSQSPVEELTKSTSPVTLRMPERQYLVGGAAIAVIVGIIALFASGTVSLPEFGGGKEDVACANRNLQEILLPAEGVTPGLETITDENALTFRQDSANIKLCLEKIDDTRPERTVAVMNLIVDGGPVHRFEAAMGESVTLDPATEALSGLSAPLIVTTKVMGESTARISIEPGAAEAAGDPTMIRVTMEFVQDSYIEWVDDGVIHNGVYMKAGQRRTLEAVNVLEIKVGNGAGVRYNRPGIPPRLAGPAGKIVKMRFKKVPDPLDPGRTRIEEEIQVAP